MKPFLLFLMTLLLASTSSYTQSQTDPAAEAFYNNAMPVINKKHVAWIKQTAKMSNEKKWEEAAIRKQAQQHARGSSLGQMDIEALVMLVMMEASKSAQEDLKAIMGKVKSINNQKTQQRELLSKMQQQKTITAIQLDSFKLLQSRTVALKNGQNPDAIKFTRSSSRLNQVSKSGFESMVIKAKNDLDSMNELGEEQMLRMQMIMDRMTKASGTASNLLKKISDTASQIVQNLK